MDELNVTLADESQKVAAFRNVFEMWPCGDTIEEHLQWRLHSPQHCRARWYVGEVNGHVVCSLGAYPMQFLVAGRTVPGFAIGAVHTLPEFRGRGFAPKLFARVEALETQRDAAIAILFSDIAPGYYARLGYQIAPSHRLVVPAKPASASPWTLTPFSASDVAEARTRYADSVAQSEFAVARDDGYWTYVDAKSPDDLAFWVDAAGGVRLGYVRVRLEVERSLLVLSDYALASDDWGSLLAALANLAHQRGLEMVGGWAPRSTAVESRPDEITMLKSLDPAMKISASMLTACDALREIDHV